MPKVIFHPLEKVCEAAIGEALLDVALNHSIPIQHACGGFCSCTTCHVRVREGSATGSLSPIEDDEQERLESLDERMPNSRLACQARVQGDVTVEVVNLDV